MNFKNSLIESDSSKHHKLLDIQLPVKKRSINYFKVVEAVKKHITYASDALKTSRTGCVANSITQLELALYYLDNVTEN